MRRFDAGGWFNGTVIHGLRAVETGALSSRTALRWGVLLLPPLLAAMLVAAMTIPGSTVWPWNPNMIDLDVYTRTGTLVLQGGDFFAAEGLPWIYPPFAALLTVPFAVVPRTAAQVIWLTMNVAALLAILRRTGLSGWTLSLATTAAVLLVEPVRETLGFGQLGIFLVAAAVLDSMPGPRVLARRVLPEGWLTGVATAVKLTPAVIAMHNFFAGKRREGVTAFVAFCLATALGAVLLWGPTVQYFGNLLRGQSGMNDGMPFKTNQSVMGAWARLTGGPSAGGLLLGLAVLVLGVVTSVLVHRAGDAALGVVLAGFTSLLASPISWSHHFVWVVPLIVLLRQGTSLPVPTRVVGAVYALWISTAPFQHLPGGDGAEFAYAWWQHVIANAGIVLGVVFVALCLAHGWAGRPSRRTSA